MALFFIINHEKYNKKIYFFIIKSDCYNNNFLAIIVIGFSSVLIGNE